MLQNINYDMLHVSHMYIMYHKIVTQSEISIIFHWLSWHMRNIWGINAVDFSCNIPSREYVLLYHINKNFVRLLSEQKMAKTVWLIVFTQHISFLSLLLFATLFFSLYLYFLVPLPFHVFPPVRCYRDGGEHKTNVDEENR
jgi:hypothetical protein